MKVFIYLILFCAFAQIWVSCSKNSNEENNIASVLSQKTNATPFVTNCLPGYHWSAGLSKCVPNCTTGLVNDPITGQCVPAFPYSGQDLFKGIFFFQGTVGSKISYFTSIRSELSNLTTTQADSLNSFITQITNTVSSLNPMYFNLLQSKVQGNNSDSIMAVMDQGAALIQSAIAINTYPIAYDSINTQLSQMDTSAYDFTTTEGCNSFLKDFGNRLRPAHDVIIPDQSACIYFFFSLAVAILDVVAIINEIAIVNIAIVGVAFAILYAKVLFFPKEHTIPKSKFNNTTLDLERETLVSSIQQGLNNLN